MFCRVSTTRTCTLQPAVLAVSLLIISGPVVGNAQAKSKAPLGYQLMCLKTPSECKGGGSAQAAGTADTMQLLERVNAQVNDSISPLADQGADIWSADVTAGDCEDYVLAKRRALIKAGLPASSLRIAYVETQQGEGHVILVVKTNSGDFVLDNLNRSVRPLSQAGYRIVSISGADPLIWN